MKYECAKCSKPIKELIQGWKCKCGCTGAKPLKGTPERESHDRMQKVFNKLLSKDIRFKL